MACLHLPLITIAWENDVIYDEIVFDIGDTGSVDLTVGSGVSSITDLSSYERGDNGSYRERK